VPARDAAVPAAAVSAVPLLAGSIRAAAGQAATRMDDSSVTGAAASLWRWLGQLPDPRDDS
jgi:hypothetical protein